MFYTSVENINEFHQPINLKIVIKDENPENFFDIKEMKDAEERAEEKKKHREEMKKQEEKMYLKR